VLALIVAAYLATLCLYPANLSERALYAGFTLCYDLGLKGLSACRARVLEIPAVALRAAAQPWSDHPGQCRKQRARGQVS